MIEGGGKQEIVFCSFLLFLEYFYLFSLFLLLKECNFVRFNRRLLIKLI